MKILNVGIDSSIENYLNEDSSVIISDNIQNKNTYFSKYKRKFLEKENMFVSFSEFKEKLFFSGKILIKEEKEQILFYEILDDKDKLFFNINSYYDSIDIASHFLKLFKEFKDYKINHFDIPNNKQSTLNKLENIKNKYSNKLEQLNYTNRLFVENFDNYTSKFFNIYKKIYFINVFNFTPFEKDIIKYLEKDGYEVFIVNQIDDAFYNNEMLKIKEFDFSIEKEKIEIHKVKNDFLQLVNLINNLKDSSEIVTPNLKNKKYEKLLNPNKIKVDKKIPFVESKIYMFIEIIYDLLDNSHINGNNITIKTFNLRNAVYNKVFSDYYNISKHTIDFIEFIVEKEDIYISKSTFDETLSNEYIRSRLTNETINELTSVFDYIHNFYNISNLNEMSLLVDNNKNGLDLFKLKDFRFLDDLDKYLEALSEVKIIEDLAIHKEWKNYFENYHLDFLKLFMKYLKFKGISRVDSKASYLSIIYDFENISYDKREKLFFINITEGSLPYNTKSSFLLSNNTRMELGLPTYRDEKLLQKYKFYNLLKNTEKSIIFTIVNEEKNLSMSSFLEEIKIENNIEVKEAVISEKNNLSIFDEMFDNRHIDRYKDEEDELFKNGEKVLDNRKISFYSFKNLEECAYKFYLNNIIKLSKIGEIEERISLKNLGIIVHEIFETIGNYKSKDIKNGDFYLEEKILDKVIIDTLIKESNKISNLYQKYYLEILFPIIKESIIKFYNSIENDYENIVNFESEKEINKNINILDNNIMITGKIDLLMETDNKKILVDYKTGKSTSNQLNFYSAIIKDIKETETIFYNAFDEEFTEEKSNMNMEEIKQIFSNFLESDKYDRTNKVSICQKCIYLNICRR